MKCPHCEKDIPGVSCPQCDATNPESANYCMECGNFLGIKTSELGEDENEFSLDERVLCQDGNCTGIIIDGRCSECGKKPD